MVEFIYALLMLAGMIKFFLKFTAEALTIVDFTLLVAAMLTVLLIKDSFMSLYFKNKFHIAAGGLPAVALLLVFYLWMIFSLIYTPSPGYSFTKVFLFLSSFLAFIFPLIYRDFNARRFFLWLVIFGTVFLIVYMAIMPKSLVEYTEVEKEIIDKYLDVGHLAALNMLILLFINLNLKKSFKLVLMGTNLISMLLSGARGPIIIFTLVLLLKLARHAPHYLKHIPRLSFKKIAIILLAFLMLAAGVVYAVDRYGENIDRTIYRLSLIFDSDSSSIAVRLSYINFSFKKIFADVPHVFMGYGVGSFGIMYTNEDKRLYPHNIALEVWFELGMIGLFFIVCYFLVCLRKLKNGDHFYVFLYLFLNSLKSSSLVDLRIMFGIMAVIWVLNRDDSQHVAAQDMAAGEPIAP